MSELYELPDGWEWKRLGDVLSDLKTGTTPPKKEQKYYNNPSINWFSPSDFGEYKELISSKNKINKIAITDKKAKIYQANTLLLVAIGATVGKIGIIREEASSNQQITAMNFNEYVNVDFSYYWLARIKDIIIDMASTATLPIINQKGIKSILFPLPPLKEQKRIVAKLDSLFTKIDKAIALHQQNIDEAEALMGSVLDEVFGELDGRYGVDSLSKTTDNPKKDIVDGPFGSNLKATEYIDSGIPIIRLQNIQRFKFIDKDIKFVSKEKAEQLQRHTFISGDIVITKLGDPLGKSCIVPDFLHNGIIVADVIRVRPNEQKALTKYIVFAINAQPSINQFSNSSKGATRQRVKLTMVRDLKIPLPPLKTQQKTVQYLDQISQKIEALKKEQQEKIQSLKDLKASLLDKAFRGEI